MDNIFLVEAHRKGKAEHIYSVGVYTTREKAELASDVEDTWRCGKYDFRIHEVKLDHISDEMLTHHKMCMTEGCSISCEGM
jgi:hypothetical protein